MAHLMRDGLPGSAHQIVRHGKVEPMSCLEIRMSSERHYVVFAESLPKPIRDSCFAKIVKRPVVHMCFQQDSAKLLPEVVYDLVFCAKQGPLGSRTQLLLNMVIPYWRDKDVRISVRSSILERHQKLADIVLQREGSTVGVFDPPLPSFIGFLLRANLSGHFSEVNITPNQIEKFALSHCCC